MKVWDGVKESAKNKKTGKEGRWPECGGEMEARKTEIAMGDCVMSDLERVGKEWEKI